MSGFAHVLGLLVCSWACWSAQALVVTSSAHSRSSSLIETRGVHADKSYSSYLTCEDGMLSGSNATSTSDGKKDPLLVFVQFSKVGSETMRDLLSSVTPKGLQDFCFMHSDGEVRAYGPQALMSERVVQGKYGLCEAARARSCAAGRSCSYLTLLRDPIKTLISYYHYFCLNCMEQRRYCAHRLFKTSSGAQCPAMSFLDFVRLLGNIYVQEFSGAYACAGCPAAEDPALATLPRCRPYEEACGLLNSTDSNALHSMLKKAKSTLNRHVLPVTLEEFYEAKSNSYSSGVELIARRFNWPGMLERPAINERHGMSNSWIKPFEPTDVELATAKEILWADLELFQHAERVYRRAAAASKATRSLKVDRRHHMKKDERR
eukprot:TRINITY_DN5642_c0_g1_i1.p1 TRINITY_DN5642_c0_g1~~TRINITY_DN5642_c0_g1_i1.p1  ORF type:complete len:376 (+),score=53.78 TRINITY_DN5642_c0_g1_i1:117-1244(+)